MKTKEELKASAFSNGWNAALSKDSRIAPHFSSEIAEAWEDGYDAALRAKWTGQETKPKTEGVGG